MCDPAVLQVMWWWRMSSCWRRIGDLVRNLGYNIPLRRYDTFFGCTWSCSTGCSCGKWRDTARFRQTRQTRRVLTLRRRAAPSPPNCRWAAVEVWGHELNRKVETFCIPLRKKMAHYRKLMRYGGFQRAQRHKTLLLKCSKLWGPLGSLASTFGTCEIFLVGAVWWNHRRVGWL